VIVFAKITAIIMEYVIISVVYVTNRDKEKIARKKGVTIHAAYMESALRTEYANAMKDKQAHTVRTECAQFVASMASV